MHINSAQFVKGFVNPRDAGKEHLPQYAFIGRSNVGKSSLINILTKTKGLAKTSSFPGRTQQINFFLINDSFHLVDLPGYGYARVGAEQRNTIMDLIEGYLLGDIPTLRKVVLVIDGFVGPTKDDLTILHALEEAERDIVVVVNKIDKIKKSEYKKQLALIESKIMGHDIVPVSAEKKQGIENLVNVIFFDEEKK